jgi:hypothetical protein
MVRLFDGLPPFKGGSLVEWGYYKTFFIVDYSK